MFKKIFIIGGHLTPALAVADELKKRGYVIYYLGRRTAYSGEKTPSVEYKEIIRRGWKFLNLPAGKIPRFLTWDLIINLLLIPLSFAAAGYYLIKYKPQAVVSFGGYLAVAPVITASLLNIPALIHEQTLVPGLANRISARFCKKICVSWPAEAKALAGKPENHEPYSKHKTVLTGNPLRQEIFKVDQKYELPMDKPLLYITGGNLGSHSINGMVAPLIPELLQKFNIIHQSGSSEKFKTREILEKLKSGLTMDEKQRYLIVPYIDGSHIGWVLRNTSLMISRSGANTVFEVIRFKIPTLFVPLPWAGRGEQLAHAKFLAERRAAVMIEQKDLTSKMLMGKLNELNNNRLKIQPELEKLAGLIPQTAAFKIGEVVESLINI